MFFKILSVFVFLNGAKSQGTSTPYVAYNSSDLSYLSNGIQFPVPLKVEQEQEALQNNTITEKLPHLIWLTNLYNHHNWMDRLSIIQDEYCKNDMKIYIEELKKETSWAVKMQDASGRYNSQFFYGNDYWLGSRGLCKELSNTLINKETPPFSVHFNVAKIRIYINEVFTPVTRQILIGQCLPTSCKSDDIRGLFLQEKSQAKSLLVVDVRPVPGDYSVINDRKFHIVGGVALILTGLILLASTVEYVIKRKSEETHDLETQNNNNSLEIKGAKVGPKNDPKCGNGLELLLSFSALTNGKKILSLEKAETDSLRCIHGLRFFSIIWIMMVHTYLEVFAIADNKSLRAVTERSVLYQTVSNATFSVDTFFFISGLLVTITYFRSAAKKAPIKEERLGKCISTSSYKIFILILYRFIRLTPAYLFVIGVNELVLRYSHNNSVYTPAIIDHLTCDVYWWRNALYINNFFPQHEFCMLWSWYIANDTQFYVLASILLVVAVRGQKYLRLAGISLLIFLFSSWVTTFVIAMKYNYVVRVEEPFALFNELYDKPWLRIGPYLIGMLTGYMLFKKDARVKLSSVVVATAWILSMACLLALVYGVGKTGIVVPFSAFYASLGHTAWGVSLAWITVACYWGYGGPVDSILTFRGFLPFSRLTYCAYLIHPVIMVYTSFLMDGPLHMQGLMVLIIFMGNSIASFMIAFLISLVFEAPVVRLLKIIIMPPPKNTIT